MSFEIIFFVQRVRRLKIKSALRAMYCIKCAQLFLSLPESTLRPVTNYILILMRYAPWLVPGGCELWLRQHCSSLNTLAAVSLSLSAIFFGSFLTFCAIRLAMQPWGVSLCVLIRLLLCRTLSPALRLRPRCVISCTDYAMQLHHFQADTQQCCTEYGVRN